MIFYVNTTTNFPNDWTQEKLSDMLAQETAAAIELMKRGVLLRIDRVVGRGGNISLWETASLEALDETLQSLPLAPYLKFNVTPLMKHRVQIAYEKETAKTGF